MRIAIDHQIFTIQEYGGVSRYFCSFARQLAGIEGVEVSIVSPFCINAYLKNLLRGVVSGIKIPNNFWNWVTGSSTHKPSPDIFTYEIKTIQRFLYLFVNYNLYFK